MSEIGLTEYDRMVQARILGRRIDLLFLQRCTELGLDPAAALCTSPLLALAMRRAAMPAGGRA